MSLFRTLSGVRAVVLVLGTAGGVLLIVSDFLTLYSVQVKTATCSSLADANLADACRTTGGEHHGYAMLLLGILVLIMTWGAAIGGSRPAGIALIAAGAAALAVTLAVDLPDIHKTGAVGLDFASAETNPRIGFWAQLVAAGLAALAGTFRLTRRG